MAKAHWMADAVPASHKGIFTAKARRAGMSVHGYAEKEKHAGGTLGKEANLALTFEHHGRGGFHKSHFSRFKKGSGHG